jgi:poly-gamma-glutamate synthesis protein (capsule biosynthesis protein)
MTQNIESLLDADLNFMNLETVITDRNDLRPGDKRQKKPYLFRMHPNGLEHLLKVGFNLVSAANNHAYDFGDDGVRETVAHLRAATRKVGAHFAGIGMDADEAAQPALFDKSGFRVAFSSIGIVTNMLSFHRAGERKPGTLGFRHAEDWERALKELEKSKADLRLLSVHYGLERDIRTDDKQRSEFRKAVSQRNVDVVIGHHAHVVRGLELNHGKLIFYGLGNFLIRGAADMGKKPSLATCCDYGLLAKVHFLKRGENVRVAAIEAIPVFDMHRIPRKLDPAEGRKRVLVLNALAAGLDNKEAGARGVRFQVRDDGTGLYCSTAASKSKTAVGKLCRRYGGPTDVPTELERVVRRAPDPRAPKKKRRHGRRKRRR